MTGDQQDIYKRLTGYLPPGWFGDSPPFVDALMQGFAHGLAFVYSLIVFAKLQTRIKTASGGWLDMIAADFFGSNLQRRTNETDTSFLNRIIINMFRERATRAAVTKVLIDLTGRAPVIIEPKRAADTGGYGGTDAITIIGTPQVFRSDWQGLQQLYSTPRTNNAASINNFSLYLGTTITPTSGTAPDGSNNASLITFTASTGGNLYYLLNNAVGPQAYSIFAKAGTVGAQFQLTNDKLSPPAVATFNLFTGAIVGTSGGASAAIQPLPNGWYRCSMLFTEPSGMAGDSIAILPLDRPGTLSLFGMQAEQNAVTSYIPTTTGPATATDFSYTAAGSIIFLAAPLIGAALSWSGTYASTQKGANVTVTNANFSVGDGVTKTFSVAPKYGYLGGYGVAGAYGSLVHQYQAFVTAYRPIGTGIPYVAGYGSSPSGYSTPSRGEYASLNMVQTSVSDADIYAAVASVIPVGTIAWMRISS
jgi:type II secretory pathway pseudopilin PulG